MVLAVAAIAGLGTAAHSQQPASLLGVPFGAALALPECPRSGPGVPLPASPCVDLDRQEAWPNGRWATWYRVFVPAQQRPAWAIAVLAAVQDDIVVAVSISTSGYDTQDNALADATAKFGKPSEQSSSSWYHRTRGTVLSKAATWVGQGWRAQFAGFDAGRLDRGTLLLTQVAPQPSKPRVPL